MAGTMVHLLVAEKLWKKIAENNLLYREIPKCCPKEEYFVAGNICPDGIMAREGYKRDMKLHTHFRDGIPDGSFNKQGMIPIFEQRMKKFWQNNLFEEAKMQGLYLGYITHMMTDERFILDERPKFFINIAVLGLTEHNVETFVYFNAETDMVDFRLIREYPELLRAKELLENIPEYEITDMITKEELTKSRKWILQHFFSEEHTMEEAKYLKYESMISFIDNVTESIFNRLLSEGYLTKR